MADPIARESAQQLAERPEPLSYAVPHVAAATQRRRTGVFLIGALLIVLSVIPFIAMAYSWGNFREWGIEVYWPATVTFGTAGLLVLGSGLWLIIAATKDMLAG